MESRLYESPAFAKLSARRRRIMKTLIDRLLIYQKKWSKRTTSHIWADFEIMVQDPNSKMGLLLWAKLNTMQGSMPQGTVEKEISPPFDFDFGEDSSVDMDTKHGDTDSPTLLAHDPVADDSGMEPLPPYQQQPMQLMGSRPDAARLPSQAEIKANAIQSGIPLRFDEPAGVLRNTSQQQQPMQQQQQQPFVPLPTPGAAPVFSFQGPRGRPQQQQQQQAGPRAIPVFVAHEEPDLGGDQIRTIYCGLDMRNKPPNSIRGNSLQCLRKGYAIGRGHIRT